MTYSGRESRTCISGIGVNAAGVAGVATPQYFDNCFIFSLQRNLEWICQSFVRHKLVLL